MELETTVVVVWGLWRRVLGCHGNMAEHMLKPNTCEAMLPKDEIGVACDCRYACRRITRPTRMTTCWVPVPFVHLHVCRLVPPLALSRPQPLWWRRISFPVPCSLVRHGTPEEARHLVARSLLKWPCAMVVCNVVDSG